MAAPPEAELRKRGFDVEVANLGKPDSDTRDYLDVVKESLELIHPDLIIVGITQGDDLSSLGRPRSERRGGSDKGLSFPILFRLSQFLFGNLHYALSTAGAGAQPAKVIAQDWMSQTLLLISQPTEDVKQKLSRIPLAQLEMFKNGDLNPGLLDMVLNHPSYFRDSFDVDSAHTRNLIEKMAADFRAMKTVTEQAHANLAIAVVPYGIYVNDAQYQNKRRMGLDLPSEMLISLNQDRAVENAAQSANLDLVTVTAEFRKLRSDRELFFEHDSHLAEKGAAYFASAIAPFIGARCRSLQGSGAAIPLH